MSEKLSPRQRVVLGYENSIVNTRRESLARTFVPSPEMERLIKLQAERPGVYASLSLSTRLGLGHYLSAKEAHAAHAAALKAQEDALKAEEGRDGSGEARDEPAN
jgi:hypothetical protein